VALLLALLLGVATLGPARTAHAATVTDCPTTETALSMDISNAGAGGTVQFNCVGSTSIPFTRAIDITQSVTLDASGILASIALDASSTRFFTVEAGASLGLTRIIMNNGTAVRAGAIDNSGSLTMTNSYIEVSQGSVAGAIVNEAHSTATITDSDLSTNSGTNGGAIYNDGTMTVSDSSFIYDSVLGGGDGAILEGSDGSATISNSTFQADQAVGGAAIENLSGGTVTLTNSTLAQNTVEYPITGAGMVNNGGPKSAFSIGGSILAGAGETNACSGLFTDLGYNLEDVASSTCGFSAGNNDVLGHDPQLSAPATNDALTYTMALGATSPAIDVIPSASCPATDQRLAPRPDASEAKCDIGAYESGGVVPPPPVPPLATTTLTTVQHPGISFGDTVTFITYVQASGVPPTGSVTFYNDRSPMGTTPLTPAGTFTSIATFSTCALPGSPGGASYQITSSYSGDTKFQPSADTAGKTETVYPWAGVSACATGISDGVGTTAVVGGSGLGSSESYGAQATGGMVGIDWMSVQSLSGDPVGSAPPGGGNYLDVQLATSLGFPGFPPSNTFTQVLIVDCNLVAGASSFYWLNGSTWTKVAASQVDFAPASYPGCATITVGSGDTSPGLSDLTGTSFASSTSPTYAPLSQTSAVWHGTRVTVRWTLAEPAGVIGFRIFEGKRSLSPAMIPVHASHRYRTTVRDTGRHALSIHVLLRSGAEIASPIR